jgi:WD40 repeat protein
MLLVVALGLVAFTPPNSPDDSPISFFRQVRPLLLRHCQGCHQPRRALGQLDVTTYAALKKGGESGDGFAPGAPEDSVLMDFIKGDPPRMPKNGIGIPLAKEQVELIARWIKQGAKDDTPANAIDSGTSSAPEWYRQPPVVTALAFSPDGQWLAVSGFHAVLLHQADGKGLIRRLPGVAQRIESLTFSQRNGLLAAAGGTPGLFGELQLWDLTRFKLKHSITLTSDCLYGVAFSPDEAQVAVGAADNTARLLRVSDGRQILRIDHHQDWVFGTAFAISGGAATQNRQQQPGARENVALKVEAGKLHLITVSRDRALKLTEADSGAFVDDINKLLDGLRCLAAHPGGEWIACGGEDGIPRLYQIFRTKPRVMMDEDLNLVRAFERQAGPITSLAFSPDGNMLAVGCAGTHEVKVYATADGQRLATLAGPGGGGIFTLAFHPSGKALAAAGHDGWVRLYQLPAGQLQHAFVPVPLAPTP